MARLMTAAGFDIMNLANNHADDFGVRLLDLDPSAVTVAKPATSRSSIVLISADAAPANDSGSKSRRSVKRQCSSVVSGIGSAS